MLASDKQGGIVPQDKEAAKKVDLITLPEGIQGTNCGNCRFRLGMGDSFYCRHPEVRQFVNARMCCAKWDAPETLRAFS